MLTATLTMVTVALTLTFGVLALRKAARHNAAVRAGRMARRVG